MDITVCKRIFRMTNVNFGWVMLLLILCDAGGCGAVSDQTITQDLSDYLFTNYSSNLLPVCTSGSNVTLSLDIALRQVMDMNEKEQIMIVNIWLRMTWNDCRLKWNQTSYSNIDHFLVEYGDVWVPDITLYDSAADEVMMPGKEDYRVYISSAGSVTYNFPSVIKSVCRVNVRYFPFDTQSCKLKFGSWSYHGLELDVWNRNPSGDLDDFIPNNEWEVVDLPAQRNVLYYNCCPEPYPDITYTIIMKRRPAFYVLTMLFPCLLTTFIAAVAFLLPVESGEKVSLEITVLLSLAVFLLVVSESLPPSSDNFPIIGNYFAASMVLVSMSCVQSVLVINVFYRGSNGRRMPRWMKVVCFDYIARFLCMRRNQVQDVSDHENKVYINENVKLERISNGHISDGEHRESPKVDDGKTATTTLTGDNLTTAPMGHLLPGLRQSADPTLNYIKEQTVALKNIEQSFVNKDKLDDQNQEWRDLSNVLDRLFLLLYTLVAVIVTLAFMLQCLIQSQ